MIKWVLSLVLLITGCVGTDPTPTEYRGIPLIDLASVMPAERIIALNGDFSHDVVFFHRAFPFYVSIRADAEKENLSIPFIRQDNYYRSTRTLVERFGIDGLGKHLRISGMMANSDRTERYLYTGFCKDPTHVDTGHNYFYCFEYKGLIYKITDRVDVIDFNWGFVVRAWVYTPYKPGVFSDYFVVGPYGIQPEPVISGVNYEPLLFID